MEIFSAIETIDSAQKSFLRNNSSPSTNPPAQNTPCPLITYNRIRICLVSDSILYFTYIKHTILTAPFRTHETKEEQMSLLEEFSKMNLQFKRVLEESNIENSYFSVSDQKSIIYTRRELQKNMIAEKEVGFLTTRDTSVLTPRDANVLTVRDTNVTCQMPQSNKIKYDFSFGQLATRDI